MTTLQLEVLEAFRSIDVPEDKAAKAAAALSASLTKVEEMADKGFSKRDADIDAIRKDVSSIKLDVVAIKGEQATVRWMLGFVLAGIVTLIFKAFLH